VYLRNQILTLAIACCSLSLLACATPSQLEDRPAQNMLINVPVGFENAEPVSDMSPDRTISVVTTSRFVGLDEVYGDLNLERSVTEMIDADSGRAIYLQAGIGNDYGDVLSVLSVIRAAGSHSVALAVSPNKDSDVHKHALTVQLSKEPEAPSKAKPNPMALDVEVKADGHIVLNGKPAGTLEDIGKLTTSLTDTIKSRANASDKIVTVKGTKTSRYWEIVKVVSAGKGTGASAIVLVVDDIQEK